MGVPSPGENILCAGRQMSVRLHCCPRSLAMSTSAVAFPGHRCLALHFLVLPRLPLYMIVQYYAFIHETYNHGCKYYSLNRTALAGNICFPASVGLPICLLLPPEPECDCSKHYRILLFCLPARSDVFFRPRAVPVAIDDTNSHANISQNGSCSPGSVRAMSLSTVLLE